MPAASDHTLKTHALIHHVVRGNGQPPIVFVHGLACAHRDWDSQVAHFSPHHQTVAVDLRGHGATPGTSQDCSIEGYGADVAEVLRALDLSPAVLVGHSMGCRVAVEAALQAPERAAALVLVDGSQFAPAVEFMFMRAFGTRDGYGTLVEGLFREMFTPNSDPTVASAVIERARRLPQPVGETLLVDMLRYDIDRLALALARLTVPVMAIQSTYANERRERQSMSPGQDTPYLAMLREHIPSIRIEVIADTGHFPQLERSAETNALIGDFLAVVQAAGSSAAG